MKKTISFTHMVILNKQPWYVHALDEDDAVEICSKYGDRVVGVACSDADIVFKSVQTKTTLSAPEPVKMIPEIQRMAIQKLTKGEKNEVLQEENPETNQA